VAVVAPLLARRKEVEVVAVAQMEEAVAARASWALPIYPVAVAGAA
jgi:hypothetical protein